MTTFTLKTGEKIEVFNILKIEKGEKLHEGITLRDENGTRVQFLKDGRSARDIRDEIFYNRSIAA